MTRSMRLHDTVALTGDLPALDLTAGEVGAVVHVHGNGDAFEVEFCDNAGATYGLHTLRAAQLIPLHIGGRPWRGDAIRHWDELLRRIAAADADPAASIPLEDLKRELRGHRRGPV